MMRPDYQYKALKKITASYLILIFFSLKHQVSTPQNYSMKGVMEPTALLKRIDSMVPRGYDVKAVSVVITTDTKFKAITWLFNLYSKEIAHDFCCPQGNQ